MKKFVLLITLPVLAIAVAAGVLIYTLNVLGGSATLAETTANKNVAAAPSKTTITTPAPKLLISMPIANALGRVTKKLFGIYVTPYFSPVSPERFTGYHTGVDFETTPAEANVDVPIYAICPGKILIKEWASGYGGVLNQSCTLSGQAVTVTYGHLRLASIVKKVGQTLAQGEQIGVLGKGHSTETDGERKHLHLGIHKGATAVITGYVASTAQLKPWINVMDYLKPTALK
jgi:murein DD-endopeptidase MepM/ murein hydrolase activator NlpD